VACAYAGGATAVSLAKPSVMMKLLLRWQAYWMMLVLVSNWPRM